MGIPRERIAESQDSTGREADSGHRTASRVLDILEHLAHSSGGGALRDLSRDLDAPKSSLLPLLRTLVRRAYLTHDEAGIYRLGAKMFELGRESVAELGLRDIAHPALEALTKKTGEGTILVTLTGDQRAVIYIDKVESVHRLRVAAAIGETRPLHSTSSGRLLLAFMAPEAREAAIEAIELVRFTDRTITSKPHLREEIAQVRRDGICVNLDQSVMGHCAIAVPIFGPRGEVVAACVLSAPKERVQDAIAQLVAEVRATAQSISQRLGYRP